MIALKDLYPSHRWLSLGTVDALLTDGRAFRRNLADLQSIDRAWEWK
ncbi:MAG: hypothetical protein RLZZ07_320, partial [Actinomycetota bacterium]